MSPLRIAGLLFLAFGFGCTGDDNPGALLDGALFDGALLDVGQPDVFTWPQGSIETVVGKDAIGLQWTALPTASYTLYWASQPGVTKGTGTAINDVKPGHIHRGLTNGQTYYYTLRGSLAGSSSPYFPEVSATPMGDFELVQVGSGSIPDLANGGSRQLSVSQLMHTILLPEGYLQAELDAGVFEQDVANWVKSLFIIDPYDKLAGAFVIWKLPRASKEHVTATDPQAADTAFRVPVATGYGIGNDMAETSKRVWQAMQGFPYPVTEYYPADGWTEYLAKSFTLHIMVFSPAAEKSGFFGKATRLYAPTNSQKRLSTAIAHSLPHEFTHAFARVVDEYLELDLGLSGSPNEKANEAAFVSNVVYKPSCATVPWKHLFFGGTYNPKQDNLVGAFGHEKLGFHSELKCLMNGTHDNAQLYGGNGYLRTPDRLCNFCREIVAFRLHERTGILNDADTAWDKWKASYRDGFYERFGFKIPQVVPQQNSVGETWYQKCSTP